MTRHATGANHNTIIQGLWLGEQLSAMERLSIQSFLAQGHEYHLYCYDDVRGVPDGTRIKDGNDILPTTAVFRYGAAAGKGAGSFAGFSNHFRYRLLLDKGGYWADLDVVCLQPFDFDDEYVFPLALKQAHGPPKAGSCVLKSPAGSLFAQRCCDQCAASDRAHIKWGETGPQLVDRTVRALGLQRYFKPCETLCPIPWFDFERLLQPGGVIDSRWRAVHLCHEMWRRRQVDKDGARDSTCIYEQLKSRYGERLVSA